MTTPVQVTRKLYFNKDNSRLKYGHFFLKTLIPKIKKIYKSTLRHFD